MKLFWSLCPALLQLLGTLKHQQNGILLLLLRHLKNMAMLSPPKGLALAMPARPLHTDYTACKRLIMLIISVWCSYVYSRELQRRKISYLMADLSSESEIQVLRVCVWDLMLPSFPVRHYSKKKTESQILRWML